MILGVDFGGTKTKWACAGGDPGTAGSHGKAKPDAIAAFLQQLLRAHPGVEAIGISLACTLVPKANDHGLRRAVWEGSSKFSSLSSVGSGFVDEIEQNWSGELDRPVFILNDGEAAALAEYEALTPTRDLRHVLVITLGTSIGAGFVFGGSVHLGPYGSRASHVILQPDGDACEQHRGCWKSLVSASALVNLAHQLELNVQEPREITKLADEENPNAVECFKRYAERVAWGISMIASAVPVDGVVLGGGIARAGHHLFEPLRDRISRGDLLPDAVAREVLILEAKEPEAAVRGAQLHAAQRMRPVV